MAETPPEPTSETEGGEPAALEEAVAILEAGPISKNLAAAGHLHEFLGIDHLGVEMIKVAADQLLTFATSLLESGYNYLQCQGGYDVGPGQDLVSMYHLIKLSDQAQQDLEELRIKVFLPRENPQVPSLYWVWKASDWQERESYDMYGIVYTGHPCLRRLLMPEDWVGWPLRKDYISPDFYELQDAY